MAVHHLKFESDNDALIELPKVKALYGESAHISLGFGNSPAVIIVESDIEVPGAEKVETEDETL